MLMVAEVKTDSDRGSNENIRSRHAKLTLNFAAPANTSGKWVLRPETSGTTVQKYETSTTHEDVHGSSRSVAGEAQEEDPLHRAPEVADAGSLATGRVPASESSIV
ncbi:hypothetical protein [Marilutibacter alkalisoli]|uniref:Uncharacterized protein n=1 Tax=Marilutibacter alkalisoli TaxID=2591633 RepID=A0A514BV65_9GAMM|nr:hypothetical protein [Lysobacter alkalisoli]QDH71257.1 hypothetical protein FKV23_15020 [Lysobacter alkalisoli]